MRRLHSHRRDRLKGNQQRVPESPLGQQCWGALPSLGGTGEGEGVDPPQDESQSRSWSYSRCPGRRRGLTQGSPAPWPLCTERMSTLPLLPSPPLLTCWCISSAKPSWEPEEGGSLLRSNPRGGTKQGGEGLGEGCVGGRWTLVSTST